MVEEVYRTSLRQKILGSEMAMSLYLQPVKLAVLTYLNIL